MSTRLRTGGRVAKVYTLLLFLTCPPVFRRRFGRDMTESFVAEWGAARAQGKLATWTCAAMAVWDALRLGAVAYVSAAADAHPAVPRLLRRPLAFVLVSLLVGGCLGLASAVLHVVALAMQPALGVTNPEQLVAICRVDPLSKREESLSLRDLQRLQADAAPLQNVAGYLRMPVDVSAGGSTRTVTAEIVSEHYFSTLGVHGVADLKEPGQALLSSRLARQFGTDATSIIVNGAAFSIAGTVPDDFTGVNFDWHRTPEIWLSTSSLRALHPGFARLPPERLETSPMLVSVARTRMPPTSRQVATATEAALASSVTTGAAPSTSRVVPLFQATTHPTQRQQLTRTMSLLIVVGTLATLLAVSTLVGFVLVTVLDRERESALRASIGATPLRLSWNTLVLTLPLLLASMATTLAAVRVALAWADVSVAVLGVPALATVAARPSMRLLAIVVLLLALSFGVTFLYVLVRVSGVARRPILVLRASATSTAGPGRLAIVAVQAAIAASVALPCAQYMAAWRVASTASPGFETKNLVLLDLEQRQGNGRATPAVELGLESIRREPTVAAAALAAFGPWSRTRALGRLHVHGSGDVSEVAVEFNAVDQHYFEALGIVPLNGRTFGSRSAEENATAIVVNQALAFALGSPAAVLDSSVSLSGSDGYQGPATIVGVVPNQTYHVPWEAPVAMVFVPLARARPPHTTLLLRTRESADGALESTLVDVVQRALPGARGRGMVTWSAYVHEVLARERFLTLLLLTLAIVTTGAAMVGSWSTVREHLHARRRDTVIRLALGATFRFLVAPACGRPLAAMGLGLAIGTVVGWALGEYAMVAGVPATTTMWTLSFLVAAIGLQLASGLVAVSRLRLVQPSEVLRHSL